MPIFDLHVHLRNRSACSHLSLAEIMQNLNETIQGICVTDHFILEAFEVSPHIPFKILFGVELTCKLRSFGPEQGDILAYGIPKLPPPHFTVTEVIDWIHDQGGCAVAAHPFSPLRNQFGESVINYPFDALELNGVESLQINRKTRTFAKRMGVPLIGGSDAHAPFSLNTIATSFPNPIRNIQDIVQAIKKQECSPYFF
jgi:predicted metal-dependent phosphoesterase TrpH